MTTLSNISENFLRLSLEDEPELGEEQQDALEQILAGENVYVYGPGGTGKSILLKHAVNRLKAEGRKVAVTATTGVAAESIGGSTIHSIAGCGIPKTIANNLGYTSHVNMENIRSYDVLFIDEISMLSGELFDRLSDHFSKIRNIAEPFGGIQLVLFGDFLQLQPIENVEKTKDFCPALVLNRGMCFQSWSWEKLGIKYVELTQIFRQQDTHFSNLLGRIRNGDRDAGDEIVAYCEKMNAGNDRSFEVLLVSTNREAKKHNDEKLNLLQGTAITFKSNDTAKPDVEEDDINYNGCLEQLENNFKHNLKKHFKAEENLALKVGAEVMMLLNTNILSETGERRIVNGTRGKVTRFQSPDKVTLEKRRDEIKESGLTDDLSNATAEQRKNQREYDLIRKQLEWIEQGDERKIPYVLFKGFNEAIGILPMEFSFHSTGLGKNVRIQIPLQLSWAVSIHKSQGMTLDSVSVDCKKIFTDAQVYVALSRCRSANGLRIKNLDSSKIKASRDSVDFYRHLSDPIAHPATKIHKWWEERYGQSQKKKDAQKILMAYYQPIMEKYNDARFSEVLSFREAYMGMKVPQEYPDWTCPSCHLRETLLCCYNVKDKIRVGSTDILTPPLTRAKTRKVRDEDKETLKRDENEASKRRRSHEQSLKDTKEELELLKHKAEVDKLKEEDIERQLRMALKKKELKELKNENREKYEEENKEEKCEEEDKDTETINKGGQSKKHKEDK